MLGRMRVMIEWKKFDPKTAPDEIEENEYLILTNGRITQATHDAMQRFFLRPNDDGEVVYSYRHITHYAEINFPQNEFE
jgi:hypothetical protein